MNSTHFAPRERAAVLWAEHVARNTAAARDDVFTDVNQHFGDAELVELTGVCGLFALSNRFQDSMQLPIEPQHEVDKIRASVRADPAKLKAYLERIATQWPEDYPHPENGGAPRTGETGVEPAANRTAIPRVPLIDPATAGGDARVFLDSVRLLLGGVPNLMRAWAHVPHVGKFVLPLQLALERNGGGGTLPAGLKALAQLQTAVTHASPYSIAHGAALARAAGADGSKVAAILNDGAATALDARERAVVGWASGVAHNTARGDDPAYDALRAHFSIAEIVELTALCAFSNMVTLFANALRLPVESRTELAALYRSAAVDHRGIRDYLERLLAAWPAVLPAYR